MKLSFVIAEPPDSFGSLEKFAFALRRVKELGYDGVELHLMRCAGLELKMDGLKGKRMMITGGCGGIGPAVSARFAKEGARVMLKNKRRFNKPRGMAQEGKAGACNAASLEEVDAREVVEPVAEALRRDCARHDRPCGARRTRAAVVAREHAWRERNWSVQPALRRSHV